MKIAVALFALVAAVAAAPSTEWKENEVLRFVPLTPFQQKWSEFKDANDKTYTSDEEEQKRMDIFRDNLKKIEFHNYLFEKGLKSFQMGINAFADMEHSEFVSVMNGLLKRNTTKPSRHPAVTKYLSPAMPVSLPTKVDWREHGYVTAVKNQGHCGSCWSFSATGSLEGQHYRKTGKLVSLSEQNLVDCSAKWGNNGCNGGLMDFAFAYIRDNDGIDTEASYPYLAQEGTCDYNPSDSGADDKGYIDVPHGDEDKLKEALSIVGPISVAIDASHESFQLYQSGVYDDPQCSSEQLDHGVLAVGYGTENGKDYWLIKNSWGAEWGDEGYVKIARNQGNLCGVATQASYPVV